MKRFSKAFYLVRVLLVVFVYQSLLWVFIYKFVPVYVTPLIVIRGFEKVFEGKMPVVKKKWVSYDKISPSLQMAVIASEDQNFQTHYGFDFEAMKDAYRNNANGRSKKIRGGSTISQQVAKNVFLWPGRSYLRKGLEAYFTLLIETFWSKKRIMEVYLNSIEMGNEVYGAQAAAKYYFKKDASKLSDAQSARIAAILPNPRKWSASKPSGYILRRQEWIQRNMLNLGRIVLKD